MPSTPSWSATWPTRRSTVRAPSFSAAGAVRAVTTSATRASCPVTTTRRCAPTPAPSRSSSPSPRGRYPRARARGSAGSVTPWPPGQAPPATSRRRSSPICPFPPMRGARGAWSPAADPQGGPMSDDLTRPDATDGISRRTALIGGAAAAGGLLGAAASDARAAGRHAGRAAPARRRVDVVVVGAGLAGLSAAHGLVARGHSVAVLEARERVGGRTLNHPVGGGEVVEVGGQWVGPGQDRILALARSLGVGTFKTHTAGAQIFDYQGRQTHFTGLIPPLPDPDAGDFGQLLGEVIALQAQVSTAAPWQSPGAAGLDGQTLETWKLAHSSTPGARFLLDLAVKAVFAAEPRDLSLLHALFYLAAGTGILYLTGTPGGAQDSRLHGGSQLISIRLAERLGARVVLGAPVRRISQDAGG